MVCHAGRVWRPKGVVLGARRLVFLARPAVQADWHVTLFGTYEPEIRDIFRAVLPAGGVALDIGANVGWHTLLMASLVGTSGRILAVEANPAMRQLLNDNLQLNRISHVEVVPCPMAESEGTMEFYAPTANSPDSGDGHIVAPGSTARAGVMRVETRRMDGTGLEGIQRRLIEGALK